MLNYVSAELYKVSHRKYPYIFLLFILVCEAIMAGALAWVNAQNDGMATIIMVDWIEMLMPMLTVGVYMGIVICDMVFSDQYKHNTLKNEVSFGIPRSRIYLGKLITQAIVGVLLSAIIIVFWMLLGAVMFPSQAGVLESYLCLGTAVLGSLPLWLGAIGLANLLFFLLKSNTVASILNILFLMMSGTILGYMTVFPSQLVQKVASALRAVLLTTPFEAFTFSMILPASWPLVGSAWLIGMGWLVVTTAIGLFFFNKREIN